VTQYSLVDVNEYSDERTAFGFTPASINAFHYFLLNIFFFSYLLCVYLNVYSLGGYMSMEIILTLLFTSGAHIAHKKEVKSIPHSSGKTWRT
jgi:hypothetical protein